MRFGLDGRMGGHRLALEFASPGNPERKIAEFQGHVGADGALDVESRAWTGAWIRDCHLASSASREN